MIGPVLKSVIRGNTGISAIIATRLFPLSEIEPGYPAIFYFVEVIPHYNKNNTTSQLNTFKVKLLAMSEKYHEAWTLAIMCKIAMENAGRKLIEGVQLRSVYCTKIADDYEFAIDSYCTITEFEIKTDNIIIT